jgi:Na+-transporting methylmalonyl-CoA/oxaloacetate decarboxylase gamma subunit
MDEDIEPKHILLGVVVLIALALFIFTMLGGFGRIIGREFQKFDAETSAQIYANSSKALTAILRVIAVIGKMHHIAASKLFQTLSPAPLICIKGRLRLPTKNAKWS